MLWGLFPDLCIYSRSFFNDKATEHLLEEGIVPEDFNDDKIGRVMDKLYQWIKQYLFTNCFNSFKKIWSRA